MTLVPAMAAVWDGTHKSKALWIDGLDVLRQPNTTGNGYGVPVESITVTEAGPDQVSSMTFTLEDPLSVVTLIPGSRVTFMDVTRDVPLFAGFLDRFAPSRYGIGRSYAVTCVGIEAVLDWMIVPSFTIPASVPDQYIAGVVAVAIGIGVSLNVASPTSGIISLAATPNAIKTTVAGSGGLVLTNLTLRQAIHAILGTTISFAAGDTTVGYRFTVDFRGGLRVAFVMTDLYSEGLWQTGTDVGGDYAPLWSNTAGPIRPSGTEHTVSAGETRGVRVVGGNTAGTGTVMDGSGKPGPVAVLVDGSIMDADTMQGVGRAYLQRHGQTLAGSTTAEGGVNVGAPGAEVRAGSLYTLSEAPVVNTFHTYVGQIVKTFAASGEETWRITYGNPLYGSQLIRRLTRNMLP